MDARVAGLFGKIARPGDSVSTMFRAGNVTIVTQDGFIGPVRADGREIVRRIFVTVRDANWREVAPATCEIHTEADGCSFSVSHKGDGVDFAWEGRLHIDHDANRLSFAFNGTVLGDATICRLGLVVLLPPDLVAGSRLRRDQEAAAVAVRLDHGLGPQRIVDGWPSPLVPAFEKLEIDAPDGSRLVLHFCGDLFELEDQRNWGDASYKIYCTPLALGYPRHIAAGTAVSHRVDLTYEVGPALPPAKPTILKPCAFPALGIEAGVSAPAFTPSFISAGLADLESEVFSAPIDLWLDSKDIWQHERIVRAFSTARGSIERIRLLGPDNKPPDAAALRSVRTMALVAGVTAPLLAGVNGYFVEWNRGQALLGEADGFAWPLSPTVHSADCATLLENGAPLGPMANHLRAQQPNAGLIVAPLAYSYPSSTSIEATPELVMLWLAAVMIDAARTGIDALCLDSTTLTHLLKDEDSATALARFADLCGGAVRPIAHAPEGIMAMVTGEGASAVLIAANLRDSEVRLPLAGWGGHILCPKQLHLLTRETCEGKDP